ncbi:MAG: hypothetical protein AAGE59_19750, partial [Cyanobacteria bacterium P01_F01_bin.86]
MALSSIPEQIRQSSRTHGAGTGRMYLLLLIAVVLSGFTTFLSFVNILYTRGITQKKFPTLVQTESGKTIEIGFEDSRYRSPETIKKFTTDTLYYLMTMTSFGPGDQQKSLLDPDRTKQVVPSMKVEGVGQITQAAWLASESLEGRFADTFKAELAKMTPPTVFRGTEEIILKFSYVEEPKQVVDLTGQWTGDWTVDVVADLKIFKMTAQPGRIDTDTIPFNKRVTVRPTSVPPITDVEEFGDLAITVHSIQQAGLQITDIKDL